MTDTTKYLSARSYANDLADSLVVHYWLQGRVDDASVQYHLDQAHEHFARIADGMGYEVKRIVPSDEALGFKCDRDAELQAARMMKDEMSKVHPRIKSLADAFIAALKDEADSGPGLSLDDIYTATRIVNDFCQLEKECLEAMGDEQ